MKNKLLVILALILCFSMIFVLASCGGDDTDTDTTQNTNNQNKPEDDDETKDSEKESEVESEKESETESDTESETDSDDENECVHAETESVVLAELTCDQNGITITKCKACGKELKRDEFIAEGHKWSQWEEIQKLDCENDGIKKRSCNVCGKSETETTETKGHIPGEWDVTDATCTEPGSKIQSCETCGTELDSRTIPALGHDWTEWGLGFDDEVLQKESTCTEQGYIGRVCLECGDEETEYSELLPHEYKFDIPAGVTCTTGGEITKGCENCDLSEKITLNPGEHLNVVVEGAKAPTYTEDGSTGIKKCEACGTIISSAKVLRYVNVALDAIPTSSSWAIVANYLNDGDMNTGVTGYGNATRDTTQTLTWETAVGLDVFILYFSGDGTGKNIGSTFSGQLANTNPSTTLTVIFYDADGLEIKRDVINTADLTEYTITFEETAEVSKVDIINLHNWDSSLCVNIWEAVAYSLKEYSVCDANGGHDWETTRVEPDCEQEKDGLETKVCKVCGETEENIVKFEHDWSDWNLAGFNCISGGTKTRECQACGKTDSETVPAGDHLNVELQGVKAPTLEEEGYTGDKVCTACGAVAEVGTAIPKLANVALGGTVTTDSTFWASTSGNIQKIIDGNRETGVCSNSGARSITDTITFKEASVVNQVILVVNGKGSTTEGSNYQDVTNKDYTISFVLYDESGNAIYTSEKYSTLDQVEIVVDIALEEGVMVGSMSITREKMAYENNLYLWEVEVIGPGKAE